VYHIFSDSLLLRDHTSLEGESRLWSEGHTAKFDLTGGGQTLTASSRLETHFVIQISLVTNDKIYQMT
jgi:hypothetical protein